MTDGYNIYGLLPPFLTVQPTLKRPNVRICPGNRPVKLWRGWILIHEWPVDIYLRRKVWKHVCPVQEELVNF